MSRNEHFSSGSEDGRREIHIPEEDLRLYRAIGEASRMDAALEEHNRTQPSDLGDPQSLREHLIMSHDWSHHDFVRDESERENVPGLSRIDWEKADRLGQMPELTHGDMRALHHHEHTTLYPEEPHVTHGDSHFHA